MVELDVIKGGLKPDNGSVSTLKYDVLVTMLVTKREGVEFPETNVNLQVTADKSVIDQWIVDGKPKKEFIDAQTTALVHGLVSNGVYLENENLMTKDEYRNLIMAEFDKVMESAKAHAMSVERN